jgi:hypothetical protein
MYGFPSWDVVQVKVSSWTKKIFNMKLAVIEYQNYSPEMKACFAASEMS